jgi:hypothetical protein
MEKVGQIPWVYDPSLLMFKDVKTNQQTGKESDKGRL